MLKPLDDETLDHAIRQMIERFRRQNEDRHRINCGDKWLKQQRMIRTDFWQKLLRATQSGSQTAVKHRRAARPACVDDSAEYQCVNMEITGGNTPWTPELIIYACENVLLELTQNAAADYEALYYAGGDRYCLVLQASRSTQDEDIRELMEIFRDFFGKNLDIGVRFRLYRRCTIDAMADALGVSMQDGCQGNTAQMNVPQLDYEHPDTDGWKKLILLGDLDSLSASIRSFLERGIRGQENPADFLGAFQVDWNLLVSAILNENTSLSLTDLRRGGFSRWLTTDLEQTTLLAMEDASRITELLDTDNFSRLNVARIRNYIQQNIADVTRSAIAEHFYFSPNYLSKLFRNVEGVPLINYIQYQRIERAKSLLATTDLSISEVAMEIGYPNFSNFSKRFQNLVGCSPDEYRRKARSAIQKGPNK